MIDIKKFIKGLQILNRTDQTKSLELSVNDAATTSTKTTVESSQTADRTISLPDATDTLIGRNTTDTLTNKTIDADLNPISNIENADIKALAAIDATKIANGSVDNTEFQTLDGVTSSIQTQIDSKVNRSGDTMTGFLTLNADPTSSLHAATKNYVDSLSAGVDPKEAVRAATIADLGFTYNTSPSNGQFTSVGGALSIDGVALVTGNRLLVKDQTDQKQNGIYTYDSTAQTLTRSTDMDGTPSSEVSAGNYTLVTAGTNNTGKGFVVLGDGILTLNTDNIDWSEFSFSAGANTFLSNLTAPVAVNQDLTPDTDNTKDLGSTSRTYAEGHINNVDAQNIRTTAGSTTIDVSNRKLLDSASSDSIDWENNLLKSGATTKLDWSATDISVNTRKIVDVVDPTADQDAATKKYVDDSNKSVEHNWELNGEYPGLTFPLLNIDAPFLAPYDVTIDSVWIYNGVAGASGTTEFDLKVKSPGGAYATILSTTGKIDSTAASDIYTDSGSVIGVQTGVTKPVLSTTTILAGQMVKWDLIQSMASPAADARIRIYWKKI